MIQRGDYRQWPARGEVGKVYGFEYYGSVADLFTHLSVLKTRETDRKLAETEWAGAILYDDARRLST